MGHLDLEAEGLSFCRQAIELLAEVLLDPLAARVPAFQENPVLLVVQAPSVSCLADHLVHLVEGLADWRPGEDHGVPVALVAQALEAWVVVALGLVAWVAVAAVAVLAVVELEALVAAFAGVAVEAEQLEVVVA